jgi:hypothetical protein
MLGFCETAFQPLDKRVAIPISNKESMMAAVISTSPVPKPMEFLDWVLLEPFGRTHSYIDTDAAAAAVENDHAVVTVSRSNDQSG